MQTVMDLGLEPIPIPLQPCCTAHLLQKGKEVGISHVENKTPGTAGPSPHTRSRAGSFPEEEETLLPSKRSPIPTMTSLLYCPSALLL